jgi:hypothetical protein
MNAQLPEEKDSATPTEKIPEEHPIPADCDLNPWSFIISSILFMREVRSEITNTPAWGFVVLCEAGPGAGILLSVAACAKACTPANNRTGTSNRI